MSAVGLQVAYRATFLFHALATFLSVKAVLSPDWLVSHLEIGGIKADTIYGLVETCSSSDNTCHPFPDEADCQLNGQVFCALWRTSSFFMWLAIVCQAAALFAYINCMWSTSRWVGQAGWKVIAGLLVPVCIFQGVATISLDVILETHHLFRTGHWRLGWCWAFATASWVLTLMLIVAITITGLMSPNDYEVFFDSDLENDDDDEDDDEEDERERDDFYYYRRETTRRYNYS